MAECDQIITVRPYENGSLVEWLDNAVNLTARLRIVQLSPDNRVGEHDPPPVFRTAKCHGLRRCWIRSVAPVNVIRHKAARAGHLGHPVASSGGRTSLLIVRVIHVSLPCDAGCPGCYPESSCALLCEFMGSAALREALVHGLCQQDVATKTVSWRYSDRGPSLERAPHSCILKRAMQNAT